MLQVPSFLPTLRGSLHLEETPAERVCWLWLLALAPPKPGGAGTARSLASRNDAFFIALRYAGAQLPGARAIHTIIIPQSAAAHAYAAPSALAVIVFAFRAPTLFARTRSTRTPRARTRTSTAA